MFFPKAAYFLVIMAYVVSAVIGWPQPGSLTLASQVPGKTPADNDEKAASSLWFGIAWSPDNKQVALNRKSSGVTLYTLNFEKIKRLEGPTDDVFALVWSADGQRLAGVSYKDISIWDASGKLLASINRKILTFSWETGARRFATGDDEEITLWEAQTYQPIKSIKSQKSSVVNVAWRPNNAQLAVLFGVEEPEIYDLDTGRRFAELSTNRIIYTISWNGSGTLLAGGGGEALTCSTCLGVNWAVQIWDSRGKLTQSLNGHTDGVVVLKWNTKRDWLATGSLDGVIIIWDVVTGQKIFQLKEVWPEILGFQIVNLLAWHPNGEHLAVISNAGQNVRIWDVASGKLVRDIPVTFDDPK